MLAYKGFDIGLICKGYHFKLGLNTTEKANCRANGFHCAENPLDCLTYYSNMDNSEYYLVNAGGDVDEDNIDSKIACTELTILQKLDRRQFFLHALAYMVDHPARETNSHVARDQGIANYGYTIVRGIAPIARGALGDVLALAREDPVTGKIVQIGLSVVDGKKLCANRWYDIDFKEWKGALV